MTEDQLVKDIVDYLEEKVFDNHISASLNQNAKLKSYKINPIIVKYLSQVLENNYTALGVAKALFYPRVLGTSINTSFGTRIQTMFVILGIASGSMISGMDIEFTDHLDNRKKWCQLKAGPNTINHDDVIPLINKFTKTINLARTNSALKGISNNDFIVGVLYGEENELSQHYLNINKSHPVIVGKEFWHRVTGFANFYDKLVIQLHKKIETLDTKDLINKGCEKLAKEIEASPLFDFS
tara:strand:+ start:596 stop:1312 length:717 start_codon:yes stop_codon:yes gene_type:complete